MSGESSTTRTRVMIIIPSGASCSHPTNTLLPQFTCALHFSGEVNTLVLDLSPEFRPNCDDWRSHSRPFLTQPRIRWKWNVNHMGNALPLPIDWSGAIPYGPKLVSLELSRLRAT